MLKIGLIREGKTPADNRVALTPAQCKWLQMNHPEVGITVQHCDNRCFSDKEYQQAGIKVSEDISDCDILMGIKEVAGNDNILDLLESYKIQLGKYHKVVINEGKLEGTDLITETVMQEHKQKFLKNLHYFFRSLL